MHLKFPLHGDAPLMSVRLALPGRDAQDVYRAGGKPPDPISAQALISTGHEVCFISRGCVERLALPRNGWADYGGDPLVGAVRRFDAVRIRVLIVGDDGAEAFAEPHTLVVDGPIWNDVDILLGFNFLRNFVFTFDGPLGIAGLVWKFSRAPGHGG